jgi:hypothetical protein
MSDNLFLFFAFASSHSSKQISIKCTSFPLPPLPPCISCLSVSLSLYLSISVSLPLSLLSLSVFPVSVSLPCLFHSFISFLSFYFTLSNLQSHILRQARLFGNYNKIICVNIFLHYFISKQDTILTFKNPLTRVCYQL